MTQHQLPPLPEPNIDTIPGYRTPISSYDSEQMTEYGQQCYAQGRKSMRDEAADLVLKMAQEKQYAWCWPELHKAQNGIRGIEL